MVVAEFVRYHLSWNPSSLLIQKRIKLRSTWQTKQIFCIKLAVGWWYLEIFGPKFLHIILLPAKETESWNATHELTPKFLMFLFLFLCLSGFPPFATEILNQLISSSRFWLTKGRRKPITLSSNHPLGNILNEVQSLLIVLPLLTTLVCSEKII